MKKLLTILLIALSVAGHTQLITEMSIAEYKSAGLRADGSVWAPYWVSGVGTKMVKVSGSMVFTQVDGGQYNHVLLRNNGLVYNLGNSSPTLTLMQYDNNGVEFHATYVECYFQTYIAVRDDGKIYARGKDSYLWFGSTLNADINAWTLIPNQPAVNFMKTRKGGQQGTGMLVALTSTGAVYTLADNTTTWNLKSMPAGGVDSVYASYNNFYIALIDGKPYGWGNRKWLNNGSGSISTWEDLSDDWSLGSHRIIDLAVNDNTIHYITEDHKLWGFGDNAQGEVGIGTEIMNRKELLSGVWAWYSWPWLAATAGNYIPSAFVSSPQQLRADKSFKRVWASDYYSFYCFAQDYVTDSLYFWGRNKSAVGFTNKGASNEATYPNCMDVLSPAEVNVFTSVTPSPSSFVPGTINAGSNQAISATSTTLSGSATAGHTDNWSYSISSYGWTKLTGPACTIVSPSSASTSVTGMSVGTYTFQLKVTDNNTATITDTVTVNVSSVPLSIAASASLTGASTASLTSTVTSPDGIAFTQWSVINRPSQPKYIVFLNGSSTFNATGATTVDSGCVRRMKAVWKSWNLIDTLYERALGGRDTRHGLPVSASSVSTASVTNYDSARSVTAATRRHADLYITGYVSNNYADPVTIHDHQVWYKETKDSAVAGGVEFWTSTTQPRTDGSAPAARFKSARDSIVANNPANYVEHYKPLATPGGTSIRTELAVGDNIHVNNSGHTILANNWIATNPFQNLTKATAVFANKNAQNTTVSGLTPGTWKLMASVQDTNGYMTYQIVTLDVPTPPTNQPPTVNAGTDQTVNAANTIVTGTANDTDGTIASYEWSKVSGPADDFIAEASSASTMITFVNSGTYVYKLIVFDNDGASAEDTITITVTVPPVQPGMKFKRFGKINFNRPN